MSDYLPENWTSAHFDGELSAAEAARAERRLEDDPVAREEVESFAELRGALAELPTRTLPSGFAAGVLAECEREMLLPAADAPGGPSSTANGSWRPVLAGMLATAALLFLGVRLATSPAQPIEREGNADLVAKTGKKRSIDRGNAFADNRRVEHNAAQAPGQPGKLEAFGGFSKKGEAGADNKVDDKSKADAAGTTSAKITQKSRQKIDAPTASALAKRLQSRIDLGSIRVGDVIPYLEIRGQQTAIIELTVMDVQNAVGQLEVLLAKNIVNPASDANSKPESIRNMKKLIVPKFSAKRKSRRELVAVYVESNKPQLTAVMASLGKQTGAVHMKLKPPVPFGNVRVTQVDQNQLPRTNADKLTKQKTAISLSDALALAKGKAGNTPGFGRRGGLAQRSRRPSGAKLGGARGRGRGAPAKKQSNDADGSRKEKGKKANSVKASAGTKAADPSKNNDAQTDNKSYAAHTPSFRLWMQLDDDPGTRNKTTGTGAGGGLGANNGAVRKDAFQLNYGRTGPMAPGRFRVIFVLRQGPKAKP